MIKLPNTHIYLLRGGLGNQLFIYSHYLKNLKLGKDVRIEDKVGFELDYRYRRKNVLDILDLPYLTSRSRIPYLWRILLKFKDDELTFGFDTRYHQKTSNLDHLREKIFTGVVKKRIAVHVRLADYDDMKLNEEDYIRMLTTIQGKEKKPVCILSDRPKEVQKKMRKLLSLGKIINLNVLDTFKFISESSDVIVSDSSFSLSASYLGPKKNIYYQNLSNIEIDSEADHQIIKL